MIPYRIQITSKAQHDFKRLDSTIRNKIKSHILALSNNSFATQAHQLKGKELAQYRLRVGDYRILFDVYESDKTVLILRIGHRKDIYR